jgi:hypothetical protein
VDSGCLYSIPDPNFSIPDPGSKRSLIRIRIKEFTYFKHNCFYALGKMISDVHFLSWIRTFFPTWIRILDPRVKKLLDTGSGSATLVLNSIPASFNSVWGAAVKQCKVLN